MRFSLSDNVHKETWDEYIMSCPGGTFADLYGWKNIYDLYGYKPFPITATDDSGRIRGILRLFLRKDIFGRKFLVSSPFLSYGGICADDEEIKKSLILKAREIGVDNNVQYIEIRQIGGKADDLSAKYDFATMVLRLDKGQDFIWNNMLQATVRNKIRQAAKTGLTVDFGMKYFDDFYRVLSVNHRDLGTPLHNKLFFRKILQEFDNTSGIIVAKHNDKVIAGMLYIFFKNVFSEPWASSLRTHNKLRPNNILYWEAIKYACKKGFEYFDFGRSTINCGTYNFKKQWGSEPVQLNYQYFLNRTSKVPQVNALDNRYQKAINIWKRLPLSVANIVGRNVIRYLPEL